MPDSQAKALQDLARCSLVLDFDLSAWATRARLVVAQGDDFEWNAQSPIYHVDFLTPLSISTSFPDLVPPPTSPGRWELWGATVARNDDVLSVELRGLGPVLQVRCRDLSVEWVPGLEPHRIDPNWHRPGRGLLRPSLVETLSLMSRHT